MAVAIPQPLAEVHTQGGQRLVLSPLDSRLTSLPLGREVIGGVTSGLGKQPPAKGPCRSPQLKSRQPCGSLALSVFSSTPICGNSGHLLPRPRPGSSASRGFLCRASPALLPQCPIQLLLISLSLCLPAPNSAPFTPRSFNRQSSASQRRDHAEF